MSNPSALGVLVSHQQVPKALCRRMGFSVGVSERDLEIFEMYLHNEVSLKIAECTVQS